MHLLTFNPQSPQHTVVTIGNFDGLHLGHQQLIAHVQAQAKEQGLASAVILFEPQPLEFLRPELAPPRIMGLGEKLHGLKQLGVDRIGVLRFNQRYAQLTPLQFVDQVLLQGLHAKSVWVGDDFRFGCRRQGDFTLLTTLAKQLDFSVHQTPSFMMDGRRLSSTWLRESLASGNIELASQIVGKPYHVRGRVVHGQKLGRQIGFPTLNIVFRQKPALSGVFAVTIDGLADRQLHGVANIGVRPTVSGTQHRLEVHAFDWQGDAYQRMVNVTLCHRIRNEQKFMSIDALQAQIQQDVQTAKAYFSHS